MPDVPLARWLERNRILRAKLRIGAYWAACLVGAQAAGIACSDTDAGSAPLASASLSTTRPSGAASAPAGPGAPPNSAPHTNPLSAAQIDAFVTAHNQARSGTLSPPPNPALPPVAWDAALADAAFNYLSQCRGTTLAEHNPNRTEDYAALGGNDYVGENIFASTGAAEPARAVASWMNEASSYNYANPVAGEAGHYTQVVWRASVRIGCALVNCPNLQYPNTILCDYAPGGNTGSQKPY